MFGVRGPKLRHIGGTSSDTPPSLSQTHKTEPVVAISSFPIASLNSFVSVVFSKEQSEQIDFLTEFEIGNIFIFLRTFVSFFLSLWLGRKVCNVLISKYPNLLKFSLLGVLYCVFGITADCFYLMHEVLTF